MARSDKSALLENNAQQTGKSFTALLSSLLSSETQAKVAEIDNHIIGFLDRYSVPLLRYSLSIVFFWFGILKPLGVSSATKLVSDTVYFLPAELFVPILGVWEMVIGVCLLHKRLLRVGIALLLLQMAGTLLPLVILPAVSFTTFPTVPSLEGQYIIKNLVLISGALVVASYSLDPLNSSSA
jgi:uncharacterized membrane protein YkgB